MRCDKSECDGKLRAVRTLDGGPGKTVHERHCTHCRRRVTTVQTIVSAVGTYGTGPHAIARRLKREQDDGDSDVSGSSQAV